MTDLLIFAAAYIAVACLICEAREAKRRRLKHRENEIRRRAMEEGFRSGWCHKRAGSEDERQGGGSR